MALARFQSSKFLAHFPLSAKATIGRIWDKRLAIFRYSEKSGTVGKLPDRLKLRIKAPELVRARSS